MPQLTLEFSSNIIEKDNLKSLFLELHTILTTTLPTELASCKSRAQECKVYCLGNGDIKNGFIHIALRVMPGRSQDILNHVGNNIMTSLKKYFSASLQQLNLQITLEIMLLEETYFKFIS